MFRFIFFSVVFTLILVDLSSVKAQNDTLKTQPIQMLKDFYTTYSVEWSLKGTNKDPRLLGKKLDSLEQKYCTQKLVKEVKDWFNDGQDLLTNTWGIFEPVDSLTIVKDLAHKNSYILSYINVDYPQSLTMPVKKKIVLHIEVVKEGGHYKIASVK